MHDLTGHLESFVDESVPTGWEWSLMSESDHACPVSDLLYRAEVDILCTLCALSLTGIKTDCLYTFAVYYILVWKNTCNALIEHIQFFSKFKIFSRTSITNIFCNVLCSGNTCEHNTLNLSLIANLEANHASLKETGLSHKITS